MDDVLEELISEIVEAMIREGVKVTVRAIYDRVSNSFKSPNPNQEPSYWLTATLYYLKDGTIIYSSNDGSRSVYEYNYNYYGDKWVTSDHPWGFAPSNRVLVQLYYTDQYGNGYTKDPPYGRYA